MEKLLVAIIVYHPDKDLLKKNLDAFCNYADKILVWENMSSAEKNKYRINLPANAIYIGENCNIGISKALNTCLNIAYNEKFDYFMSMDQDSIWHDFASFKKTAYKILQSEECIIGPYIQGSKIAKGKEKMPIKWLITSGMFSKVNTYKKIGGYNENFFVDSIDIELSLRAHSKNISTYICEKGQLIQSFGERNCVHLFYKDVEIQYYSPNRTYNIFKGNMILYRIYKNKLNLKELLIFLKLTLISSVFNHDKKRWRRLFCMVNGIIDGIKCKKELYT